MTYNRPWKMTWIRFWRKWDGAALCQSFFLFLGAWFNLSRSVKSVNWNETCERLVIHTSSLGWFLWLMKDGRSEGDGVMSEVRLLQPRLVPVRLKGSTLEALREANKVNHCCDLRLFKAWSNQSSWRRYSDIERMTLVDSAAICWLLWSQSTRNNIISAGDLRLRLI